MAAGVVRSSSALLAVLFIASGVVAGVTGTKYRGQSEVKRGQAFNVTCTVSINEGVSWTKDGKNLTAELGPFSVDERKINDSVEATLTVQNAKTAHAGSYQCSALHAAEKHTVRLTSDTTITGVYDLDDIRMLDLTRTSFNLTCKVNPPAGKSVGIVNWYKEKVPVSNSTIKDRYQITMKDNDFVLNIKPVNEDDYGNYTCQLQDQPEVFAAFKVYGKPHVRLHPNQNVVEGQKIKILCTVLGKPYPTITWQYNNETVGAPNETVTATERITFNNNEAGVENAVLVLTDAVPGDYGKYYCVANSTAGNYAHVAGTTLRVKDKYAALWPFIGICAEVIVLCAIILVYEKRRGNNTENEDSDTDNRDQKQPITNKDTTGLHQRK